MLLQRFREMLSGVLLYIVVAIVCVPFALFGINEYFGDSSAVAVAEVNGEEISQQLYEQSFQREYQRYIQQLRANAGPDFDISAFEDNIRENMRQQVLVQMVNTEAILQEASKAGLRIGDGMLSTYIRALPDFQQGGQFSNALYTNALYSIGMSSQAFEDDVREQMLLAQIQQGVVSSSLMTDWEKQRYVQLNAQEREIQYTIIPASRFADAITVSDEDIVAHYEANQSKYFTPERVSVEYIELSHEQLSESEVINEAQLRDRYESQLEKYTTPPEWTASHILIEIGDDEEASRQQAEEILAKANAGEDFGELAKAHSIDTGSAQNNGELGSFGPGRMVAPFEEALKSMQADEIKGPIKTRFGWHIIKLTAATPSVSTPFDEVREEIQKAIQLEKAETEFFGRMEQFANLAFEQPDNLDILSEELGLEKKVSGLFERNRGIGVLANPKISSAAFSVDVLSGQNSEILELGERHVMVLRINQHDVPQPKPLEEVKEQIRTELLQTNQRNGARKLGEQVLATLQTQPWSDNALQEQGLTWTQALWIKRRDSAISRPQITIEAFKMGRPQDDTPIYAGLSLGDDYALIALRGVRDGEPDEETETQTETYARAFGESAFQWMVAGIKERSDIQLYTKNIEPDEPF
ncbi:MAG: SurA N-terminal domain-containing protein [Pseudomonadota bacterium]